MLISFVGSPCSGKTTTAAMLFSKLKEGGLPVEFLGEYARLYIAKKRLTCLKTGEPFSLTDTDQWNIMQGQAEQEAIMDQSLAGVDGGLVVSDTSSLNAVLYMSAEARADPLVRTLMRNVAKNSYLVFYAKPVDNPAQKGGLDVRDPNRVHTHEQSRAVDEQIPDLLKNMDLDHYTLLIGSPEARLSRAFQAVNSRLGRPRAA